MKYEVHSKYDLSGATLVVRFPETELDRKALYTIEAEHPDFLVPFHYCVVDNQIEISYQLGNRTKLQYRFGKHETNEYIDLWERVLQPLLDCGDWFLNPFSFVMDVQYLFVDKQGKIASYLYVPTLSGCEDIESLRKMVMAVSQENIVADPQLENKVLKAIMQDFRPKDFLKMLQESREKIAVKEPVSERMQVSAGGIRVANQLVRESVQNKIDVAPESPVPVKTTPPKEIPAADNIMGDDDIVINISMQEPGQKAERKGLFGKKNKPEKEHKKENKKESKKESKKEKKAQAASTAGGGKWNGFWSHAKSEESDGKEIRLGAGNEVPVIAGKQIMEDVSVWMPEETDCGATQLLDEVCAEPHFRLVGDPSLPPEIRVSVSPGQVFTIGRFDVELGYQQSSFEFDKRTKGVSRHHAAIERMRDGCYVIVDQGSSGGTFVNGQRIAPNAPMPLHHGSRVNFGPSGAEYIWEGD